MHSVGPHQRHQGSAVILIIFGILVVIVGYIYQSMSKSQDLISEQKVRGVLEDEVDLRRYIVDQVDCARTQQGLGGRCDGQTVAVSGKRGTIIEMQQGTRGTVMGKQHLLKATCSDGVLKVSRLRINPRTRKPAAKLKGGEEQWKELFKASNPPCRF